ncbi:MAG: adenosine deaminase, partial [Promethearchaeota archaeon]
MNSINKKKDLQQKILDKSVLKNFPKVELHRHLEGTFSIENLFEISVKNNLDTPKDFTVFKRGFQFPKNEGPDFLTFISKFKDNWFRSLEDIYSITYNSVKKLRDDGIFYIELRFSPHYFARFNQFDRKEVTRVIIDAGNTAAREINIEIRYLITFSRRSQTPKEMIELYDQISSLDLKEIVGIDLASYEKNYPPRKFISVFNKIIKENNYKATIHAGEVTPSDYVWSAIKNLHASRIGHGTSVIYDKKLQRYIKRHNIALEQCITSNYLTGSWIDEKNHPFGRLYRKGIPVVLNSDDPSIQDSDLTDDYLKALNYFSLSIDDLIKINKTALKSAFIPEEEKHKLLKDYMKKVNSFKDKYGL